MRFIDDRARVLRLFGDGFDGMPKDVAFASTHVEMLELEADQQIGAAAMGGEEWWVTASDDDLVREAGPVSAARLQAQAELTRRLTMELHETRTELAQSSDRIKWLTWALIVLTAIVAALTGVLVVQGAA